MNFNGKLLKDLVGIYGPCGNEERVVEYIKNEIKDCVDEMHVDNLGNLIARKKGNGSKVMISGHMDQIGLMVTDIDDKGYIRVTNIGGINPFVTIGERFEFENGIIGIASCEPVDDKNKLKLEKIFLDIGATSKEEAQEKVNIGDMCVYYSEYYENEKISVGRAMDDRIGCFVMIESLKNLKENNNDLYFVFSTQEEVGLRGARTSAYSINPDLGIAVDITGSGDTPGAKRFAVKLHNGAAIKVRDNSMLTHPKVKKLMVDTAKENDIKYQIEVLEFGGTDAGAIHLTREGVPSGTISIPTRYVHSAHETISKEDVISCIDLLTKILEKELEF